MTGIPYLIVMIETKKQYHYTKEQFELEDGTTLAQEASTLGLKPGEYPTWFTIEGYPGTFSFSYWAIGGNARYRNDLKMATIFND